MLLQDYEQTEGDSVTVHVTPIAATQTHWHTSKQYELAPVPQMSVPQDKNITIVPALWLVTKGDHVVYWIYCIVQIILLLFLSVMQVLFFLFAFPLVPLYCTSTSECGKKFLNLGFFQLNVMTVDRF